MVRTYLFQDGGYIIALTRVHSFHDAFLELHCAKKFLRIVERYHSKVHHSFVELFFKIVASSCVFNRSMDNARTLNFLSLNMKNTLYDCVSSKKQNVIALSITKVEYVAASYCAQLLYLKQMLEDYGLSQNFFIIYVIILV